MDFEETLQNSALLRQGYLTKQGGSIKTWRKRWFVVTHNEEYLSFFYFKAPPQLHAPSTKRSKPLGSFALRVVECFRVLEPPASPLSKPVMEVITPRRNYQMTADSEQELREWAWTIERSIGILREQNSSQLSVSAPLSRSGYLKKRGGKRRNWKTRWFQLENGRFEYFSIRENAGAPLGSMDLSDIQEATRVFHPELQFQFHIRTNKRVYMLRAPNEGELLDWLRTLERAGCLVGTADASSATMFYDDVGDSDSDDDGSSTALGAALSAIADRASPDVKDNSPDRQSGLVKHRAQTAAVTYGNLAAPVSDLDFSTFDSFQDLHKYLQPQCLVVAGLKGAGPGPRTPTLARATVPDEATRMPPGDVTVSLEGGKRRSVTLRTTMDDNVPARAATLTPLNEAPHAFDAAANVASRDPARMGAAAARFARTNPQECQLSSSGRRLSRSAQDIRAPSAAASLASTADDAPPDRSRSFSLNNPFNVDELRKAGYRPDASLGHSPA